MSARSGPSERPLEAVGHLSPPPPRRCLRQRLGGQGAEAVQAARRVRMVRRGARGRARRSPECPKSPWMSPVWDKVGHRWLSGVIFLPA